MQISYLTTSPRASWFARQIGLGFLLICVCYLGAHAQVTASKDDPFKTLVAKLKGGDTTVDFKAMRMASADSKEEDAGEADRELRSKALEAINSKKYEAASKAAEKALQTGYVDIEMHLVMAVANRELGDSKKFEFHKAAYLGLLNSILDGADGKSAKTAYVVISVSEEYSVLGALGLARGSQSLRNEGGHAYDVLSVTDPKTKATQNVWFNIDIVWKGYEKIFK